MSVPPLPSSPVADGDVTPDTERLMLEPATRCLNCGAVLPGAYCPDCGQKAQPLRVPLRHVIGESFVEMFGLDGRFWRSMGGLLFRPGRLTRAYLDGRRTRYLRPFRLYLTATLAFFFLLSVFDPVGRIVQKIEEGRADSVVTAAVALAHLDARLDTSAAARRARADARASGIVREVDATLRTPEGLPADGADIADAAVAAAMDSARAGFGVPMAEMDSSDRAEAVREQQRLRVQRAMLASMPPDSLVRPDLLEKAAATVYPDSAALLSGVPSWMGSSQAIRQFNTAQTRDEQVAAVASFSRTAISKIPTVMFLLLPLFALLLKLLYARREWLYADHLVFALHTHAFAFFVFAALVGLVVAGDGASWTRSVALSLSSIGIPLYWLVAQKRVYGQGWPKTLVKASLLAVAYSVVLTFGLVGAMLLAAAA